MNNTDEIKQYSSIEESINIVSHAIGFLLSIAAMVLLIDQAYLYGSAIHIISFAIFGMSLITLYAASTIYHSAVNQQLRAKLRIVDHASIYILIAGTYTPFTLITLSGTTGWVIFSLSWSMACIGIVLKLFFTGRFDVISTIMYVFMGWLVVFALDPLISSLAYNGLMWLLAGGVFYTLGAVLYSIDRIRLNHAIFHIFVLIGSFCHFISVFFYVLPGN